MTPDEELSRLTLPELESALDAAMQATEQAEQAANDARTAAYEAREAERYIRREWERRRERERGREMIGKVKVIEVPPSEPTWKRDLREQPPFTRRLRNIIKMMCSGEEFYSRSSPRMTEKEANALDGYGFVVQCHSCHGSDRSAGRVYFPLHKEQFIERARAIGIISE